MALTIVPLGFIALMCSGTEYAPIPALLSYIPITYLILPRKVASGQRARRPLQSLYLRRRSPSRYG